MSTFLDTTYITSPLGRPMPFLTLILGRSLAQWAFPILTQIFGNIGKSASVNLVISEPIKVSVETPQRNAFLAVAEEDVERTNRQAVPPQLENFGYHWQQPEKMPRKPKQKFYRTLIY